MPTSTATARTRGMSEGVSVEVRCRYDGHWCHGFTIHRLDVHGVTIARDSDGAVLPVVFAIDDVRLVMG